MNVLVTGGTGFLGRHLVQQLTDAGDRVRLLVRPSRDGRSPRYAGPPDPQPKVEEVVGDLCDPSSLDRALSGMEAVCHCAARVETGGDWSEFEAVNIRATEKLLETAWQHKVIRFLYVSSLSVYTVQGQTTITEDSPLEANAESRGYYARSKIEAERVVRQYAQAQDYPLTVVRPGILYGPGRPPFVSILRRRLGSALQLVIARPDQRLPLAYVDNVAEAMALALHSEKAVGRTYNLVDQEAIEQGTYLALLRETGLSQTRTLLIPPAPFYPLVSLVEQACRLVGVTPPLSRHQLEGALSSIHYETTRARDELGWHPKVTLVEALKTMRAAQGETNRA